MSDRHVLSIVIPALNEEAAIGSTLQRCLDARDAIRSQSRVREVEILVVSDGSTDRTEEIAKGFDEVSVLAFDRNRGYGAAIQCGFAHARGDLLGFVDADGTCDPAFFAPLCRAIDDDAADLVLGSRRGADSEMPLVRALGNAIFAWILGLLARQRVADIASGMRVLRRSALPHLYPLPDGLHFTPAMSARALLEGRLRVVELPMKYAERIGRSKLHVWRDGVRFLVCIVHAAMAYRPARPLLLAAGVALAGALALAAGPALFFARTARLEEWMIYRLLFASLLASASALVVGAAVVADRVAVLAHARAASAGVSGWVGRRFNRRNRRIGGLLLIAVAALLLRPGLFEYATTGQVTLHWSRVVLASLALLLAVALASTTFLLHMLELIEAQRGAFWQPRPATEAFPPQKLAAARLPDRVHAPRDRGATRSI
jgi:hypothetical protein